MKATAVLFLVLLAVGGQAHAAKACEELKTEIATKLDGKGVKGYALTVVASDKEGDAKVVGSCDGGKQKIVYSKK
jgi:predicted lipoprotein with Yx(FWY)xxD motif